MDCGDLRLRTGSAPPRGLRAAARASLRSMTLKMEPIEHWVVGSVLCDGQVLSDRGGGGPAFGAPLPMGDVHHEEIVFGSASM
eukprot:7937813-Pyramimonas_sp.AAC.1